MPISRRNFIAGIAIALPAVAVAANAQTPSDKKHRLVVHLDDNDVARMNMALNNISNVYDHYRSKGESIAVELVAYGPGLHIFRADTSPVKQRFDAMKMAYENLVFSACGNTMTGMEKAEGKPVALVPDVQIVEAGVVRIMELQEQGWSYVRP